VRRVTFRNSTPWGLRRRGGPPHHPSWERSRSLLAKPQSARLGPFPTSWPASAPGCQCPTARWRQPTVAGPPDRPPILLPMRGPGAVHPNIQENRCAARLLDPHRHIGWRGRLLAVAGTPIPLGLRPEEDGLTTEPGRHTPESFGASRNGDAYVSFGHAAFVQLADVVQGGGDDSAAIVVGPVI
jgi:hypothetical protein